MPVHLVYDSFCSSLAHHNENKKILYPHPNFRHDTFQFPSTLTTSVDCQERSEEQVERKEKKAEAKKEKLMREDDDSNNIINNIIKKKKHAIVIQVFSNN